MFPAAATAQWRSMWSWPLHFFCGALPGPTPTKTGLIAESTVQSRYWRRGSPTAILAIEHTLIQPFVNDKEDFAFFAPAFLKIENDQTLVVPDRWDQIFIPVGTLHGLGKSTVREVVVKAVQDWIRANRLSIRAGEHDYRCLVTGMSGAADFEVVLTIKSMALPGHGQLNIRRQQVGCDFGDVVKSALRKKLPKLANQKADKRILMLERQHMNLVPRQILDEVSKQGAAFTQMALVDEIWILETIGYQPGGYFRFELLDDNDRLVAGLDFGAGVCTGRSKDGMPIPM